MQCNKYFCILYTISFACFVAACKFNFVVVDGVSHDILILRISHFAFSFIVGAIMIAHVQYTFNKDGNYSLKNTIFHFEHLFLHPVFTKYSKYKYFGYLVILYLNCGCFGLITTKIIKIIAHPSAEVILYSIINSLYLIFVEWPINWYLICMMASFWSHSLSTRQILQSFTKIKQSLKKKYETPRASSSSATVLTDEMKTQQEQENISDTNKGGLTMNQIEMPMALQIETQGNGGLTLANNNQKESYLRAPSNERQIPDQQGMEILTPTISVYGDDNEINNDKNSMHNNNNNNDNNNNDNGKFNNVYQVGSASDTLAMNTESPMSGSGISGVNNTGSDGNGNNYTDSMMNGTQLGTVSSGVSNITNRSRSIGDNYNINGSDYFLTFESEDAQLVMNWFDKEYMACAKTFKTTIFTKYEIYAVLIWIVHAFISLWMHSTTILSVISNGNENEDIDFIALLQSLFGSSTYVLYFMMMTLFWCESTGAYYQMVGIINKLLSIREKRNDIRYWLQLHQIKHEMRMNGVDVRFGRYDVSWDKVFRVIVVFSVSRALVYFVTNSWRISS